MKKEKETDTTDDSAQLILIAGLLVAVAVVSIAVIVGGGFFSQATDDGGLSGFSAQMDDQVGTAERVSQEDLQFVNRNSAKNEGRNHTEVCGEMVNTTKLQQQVASELAEDEVILDIELMGDCDSGFGGNRSWLAGQTKESNLPSVNVTDPVDVSKVCGDADSGLHGKTGYPDHISQFVSELKSVYAPNNVPEDPATDKMVQALENADDINLDALTAISPEDYVEDCIEVEIEEGRDPVDVVFAIDTTGSMGDLSVYSGDFVSKPWENPPHSGDFPRDVYRPKSDVPIRDGWLDTDTVGSWTPGGSPAGDIVYDDYVNELARVTSSSPTGTVCGWFSCDDTWGVEYRTGGTDDVPESDLEEVRYRLEERSCGLFGCSGGVPERMWFTQKGLMSAVDDLNRTEPDRAGLVEYDTSQNELAGVAAIDETAHRNLIKDEAAKFIPDGGTDIAGGLQEAKSILDRDYGSGPEASTTATKNIVLMTDGKDNDGDDPVNYIQSNEGAFESTFIHSVILGSTAANDEDAVEDMAKLANDPNPDLSSSSVTESDLPDTTLNRPNGTLIASDDPSDAEDIFDDIINSIEDETEFEEPNSSITDPGEVVDGAASSGAVEDIYDFRMNITDFTGNGTYLASFVNTDASDNEQIVWQMEVDNKLADNDASTTGYEVEFTSETHDDDSLNETLKWNFEGNLSRDDANTRGYPNEYVWLDLADKDSDRPRFKMGPSGPDEDDYDMEDAWQEVQDEMYGGGVAIETFHDENSQYENTQEVNGTFSLDFKPLNGDFSRVGNLVRENGSDTFVDACDSTPGDDAVTCGWEDNSFGAVSTAQIRDAKVLVTVEGPGGISEREVRIEDFVDIYEEGT